MSSCCQVTRGINITAAVSVPVHFAVSSPLPPLNVTSCMNCLFFKCFFFFALKKRHQEHSNWLLPFSGKPEGPGLCVQSTVVMSPKTWISVGIFALPVNISQSQYIYFFCFCFLYDSVCSWNIELFNTYYNENMALTATLINHSWYNGMTVAQYVERLSAHHEVSGLIPSFSHLHVNVSLGEILYRKVLSLCVNG